MENWWKDEEYSKYSRIFYSILLYILLWILIICRNLNYYFFICDFERILGRNEVQHLAILPQTHATVILYLPQKLKLQCSHLMIETEH